MLIYRKGVSTLEVTLQIIQVILSVTMVVLVLMQGKGGGLGGIFGGDGGVYKTRRGVEKVVFQATIAISVVFFAVSLLIVIL